MSVDKNLSFCYEGERSSEACIGKDKADETKKAINMVPQEPIKVQEGKCWDFCEPEAARINEPWWRPLTT